MSNNSNNYEDISVVKPVISFSLIKMLQCEAGIYNKYKNKIRVSDSESDEYVKTGKLKHQVISDSVEDDYYTHEDIEKSKSEIQHIIEYYNKYTRIHELNRKVETNKFILHLRPDLICIDKSNNDTIRIIDFKSNYFSFNSKEELLQLEIYMYGIEKLLRNNDEEILNILGNNRPKNYELIFHFMTQNRVIVFKFLGEEKINNRFLYMEKFLTNVSDKIRNILMTNNPSELNYVINKMCKFCSLYRTGCPAYQWPDVISKQGQEELTVFDLYSKFLSDPGYIIDIKEKISFYEKLLKQKKEMIDSAIEMILNNNNFSYVKEVQSTSDEICYDALEIVLKKLNKSQLIDIILSTKVTKTLINNFDFLKKYKSVLIRQNNIITRKIDIDKIKNVYKNKKEEK